MNSKLNVAYSFSWVLPTAEIAQVRAIIESLRQYAIDLGHESVSEVIVLTGNQAHAGRSDADHVIMFTASVINARSESARPAALRPGIFTGTKVLDLERHRPSFQLQRD